MQLQASLALVQNVEAATSPMKDEHGRKPFSHPATRGLPNLSADTKSFLTDRSKLADLAMERYEMQKVIRWNPRDVSSPVPKTRPHWFFFFFLTFYQPTNLEASGLELILAHTLYAVVGAVSLEKGGQYANEVAKERILAPLGVKVA